MRKGLLIALGVVLICFGLLIPPITTVVTFLLKPSYASTAIVSISPSNQTTIATEMVRVQSAPMLDHVITNLNLTAQWGRKFGRPGLSMVECQLILKGSVQVTQHANAQFIIRGFSDDKDEAAAIANALAEAYRVSTPGASVAQPAVPSPAPFRPNKRRNILLGFVVGMSMVVIGALLTFRGFKARSQMT